MVEWVGGRGLLCGHVSLSWGTRRVAVGASTQRGGLQQRVRGCAAYASNRLDSPWLNAPFVAPPSRLGLRCSVACTRLGECRYEFPVPLARLRSHQGLLHLSVHLGCHVMRPPREPRHPAQHPQVRHAPGRLSGAREMEQLAVQRRNGRIHLLAHRPGPPTRPHPADTPPAPARPRSRRVARGRRAGEQT